MESRTRVVHVLDPIDSVYIGRQNPRYRLGRSRFANPYKLGAWHPRFDHPLRRADVLTLYREMVMASPKLLAELPTLRNRVLSCWCRHDGEERTSLNECHGDVLLSILDDFTDDQLIVMSKAP